MRSVTSFKESMLTRGRSRWGTVIPEQGLDAYMTSLWYFFVSVPAVGLFCVLVVALGIWSNGSSDVPNPIGVGATTVLTIAATSSWFVLHNRVKRVAGRALGLSARDSRRLDVGSPELLSASLARIRGGQRQVLAVAGASGMATTAGGRDGVARSSDGTHRVQRVGARTVFARVYLVIALGLVVYTASLGWQPFLAESAGFALIGIPMGLMVARLRRLRSRRLRVIAAQLPGWQLYGATPALAELAMLHSADFQPATSESLTIAYGPGGIQVWAGFRPPHVVCALPWHAVVDVRTGDIQTVANTTRPGLVVLLDDGSRHEFQLTRRRDFSVRSVTRAQLAVLVDEIRASRPLAGRASS